MPTTTTSSSTTSRMMMPSLPAGFRFHPTDEELIVHYLMNQAAAVACPVPIIAEVNIYHCNPWDLPPKALFGDKEWYFFSPRERKYPNGARPNRAAGSGYWKATGTDKAILSSTASVIVGVKKALVFYRGKPPRGVKTDWIMHEYRLTADGGNSNNNKNTNKRRGSSSSSSSMRLDDWVLCRIHKKSNNFQLFSSSDHQEQEDGSTVEEEEEEEDTALHPNNNTTMSINDGAALSPNSYGDHYQPQLPFPPLTSSMPKSCSLTDLLSTIDYSTLSQLLLDAPPEPTDDIPYSTPPAACHPLINLNNNHDDTSMTMPQQQGDALFLCSDEYGAAASFNYTSDLKRKRIMNTTDDGASTATTSSLDDGNGSLKKKLVLHLPSDSRSGYCNQQLAEAANYSATSSSVQYHPFLNQQLILNNHLEMHMQ